MRLKKGLPSPLHVVIRPLSRHPPSLAPQEEGTPVSQSFYKAPR